MNSIFTIISYNLPWYKINNIKGFTISYSNYFRFFKKLLSSNIFNLVYSDLVKYKFSDLKNYDKIFSIDSTIIFNNNGSEEISKIPNYTKKKGSKLSIIIHNETLIPISVSISDAKTSDINLLEKNILASKINLKNSTILGDKGYISQKIKNNLKNNSDINLLTYKRKNMYNKNTDEENIILKQRVKIENFFSIIKNKYKMLKYRNQKKYIYFESMIIFSLSMYIIGIK